MKNEEQAIEVEVVAIDGQAPPAPRAADPAASGKRSFDGWQRQVYGRVRTLDSRWWPLWVLLGIIAIFLVVTIGLVVAVVYLCVKAVLGIFRALLSLFSPGSGSTSIR